MRYLTFSCYQRRQLFGTPALRRVFVEALRRSHAKGNFELIARVIMPEHIHLMVRPMPGVRWVPIAAGLKTSAGNRILNRWNETRAPILPRLRDLLRCLREPPPRPRAIPTNRALPRISRRLIRFR